MSKQRIVLVLSVILLLTAACNLSPQTAPATEDPGAIDTMVAQTVAASGGQIPTEEPADSQDGGDDQQPTAETLPTDTPQPSDTPEPSATPEPTDTQEPPPSAIDALNLGSPDASYGFNGAGTFYTYTSPNDKVEIKDGTLQFTINDAIGYTIWSFSALELEDYYFEINVIMPADCVGKDRGGIIFGTPPGETDNGANFQVSCDGNYRLFIYDGVNTVNLANWTESSEINEGPNSVNRLGVLHKENKISLYMNGIKLDTITDDTYVGIGRIGVNMGVDDHDNVIMRFDDAAYWTSIP
jgi:hypothetical protein